jgi:hypothetical protein
VENIMTTEAASENTATETHLLIESDRVQGTPVYRSNGERVGTVERVMIDKVSGQVAYAVISFGGVLGTGLDHYPLPWNALTHGPRLEGYESTSTGSGLKLPRSAARRTPGTGRAAVRRSMIIGARCHERTAEHRDGFVPVPSRIAWKVSCGLAAHTSSWHTSSWQTSSWQTSSWKIQNAFKGLFFAGSV